MKKMYTIITGRLLLNVLMCVAVLMPGFSSEAAAKNLKPASVEKYDVEMQQALRVDKDNNLYHVYAVEKDESKHGVYTLDKRYIEIKRLDKINTPDYVCYANFDGLSDNFFYTDKKGMTHYCNTHGKDIAVFSLDSLWEKTEILTGGVKKRKKNKICLISRNGYKNVKTIYAEYDIKKKKFTKKKNINVGDEVVDFKLYGKYICGLKISGKIKNQGGKVIDDRKHSIVVYDLDGRLQYELDYSYLTENYTNKNIADIMEEYEKYHWDISDIEEMSKELFDVRGGYIYIAARNGIYRCKIGKRTFQKVVDLRGCEFTAMNWRNYLTSFVCVNKNKFALKTSWYDEGGEGADVYVIQAAKQ